MLSSSDTTNRFAWRQHSEVQVKWPDAREATELPHAERGEPTHKAKRYRYHDPVDHQHEEVVGAEKVIAKEVAKVFKKTAKSARRQVLAQFEKIAKAGLDDSINIDLSDLNAIPLGVTAAQLKRVAKGSAARTIAQIGPDTKEDLVNRINERAEAFAEDRAAEMVGMRWVEGELVENPDARWAITETTRDIIRALIDNAMKTGQDVNDLAANIENSTAFDEDRAMMVARTETIIANNQGAMTGYFGARDDLGLNVLKEWMIGEGACPICEANQDQGPIDLDEPFQSDDDQPPAHPNCRCAIAPVVVDDSGNVTDEGDAEDNVEAVAKFDPDQPRDEHGRWSPEGGGSSSAQTSLEVLISAPAFSQSVNALMAREDLTGTEQAYVIGEDGELLQTEPFDGGFNSVSIPENVAIESKGGMVVHNHPVFANLSVADLNEAGTYKSGVSAVTPDGGTYTAFPADVAIYRGEDSYRVGDVFGKVQDDLETTHGFMLGRLVGPSIVLEEMGKRGMLAYKASPGSKFEDHAAQFKILASGDSVLAEKFDVGGARAVINSALDKFKVV